MKLSRLIKLTSVIGVPVFGPTRAQLTHPTRAVRFIKPPSRPPSDDPSTQRAWRISVKHWTLGAVQSVSLGNVLDEDKFQVAAFSSKLDGRITLQ